MAAVPDVVAVVADGIGADDVGNDDVVVVVVVVDQNVHYFWKIKCLNKLDTFLIYFLLNKWFLYNIKLWHFHYLIS